MQPTLQIEPEEWSQPLKIKVWYVLEASMLTSESEVSLFRTEIEARKDFDERKKQLIDHMGQSTYDELKTNRDSIQEGDDMFWVDGQLVGGADIYLDIGAQVI